MAFFRGIPIELWGTQNEVWVHGHALYVIEELGGEFCKVGVATHPLRRFSSLQTGNPRMLVLRAVFTADRESYLRLEKLVLQHFKPHRGEWLVADCEDIISFISNGGK